MVFFSLFIQSSRLHSNILLFHDHCVTKGSYLESKGKTSNQTRSFFSPMTTFSIALRTATEEKLTGNVAKCVCFVSEHVHFLSREKKSMSLIRREGVSLESSLIVSSGS